MTELILIRHGETDWNRELRFQGQLDVPLNATGLEQARRVAERLAGEPLDALFSSDLQRALQTARALAQRAGHDEPLLEAGLREQHFGMVEGLRVPEIQQRYPQAWPDGCASTSITPLTGVSASATSMPVCWLRYVVWRSVI